MQKYSKSLIVKLPNLRWICIFLFSILFSYSFMFYYFILDRTAGVIMPEIGSIVKTMMFGCIFFIPIAALTVYFLEKLLNIKHRQFVESLFLSLMLGVLIVVGSIIFLVTTTIRVSPMQISYIFANTIPLIQITIAGAYWGVITATFSWIIAKHSDRPLNKFLKTFFMTIGLFILLVVGSAFLSVFIGILFMLLIWN